MLKILKQSKKSKARLGALSTPHGKIETPFFMPVATRGAIKGVAAPEMKEMGARIILSNTYHLFLRPGLEIIKKAGGLHKFMGWNGPILTDSGGYQVFSLAKMRKITPEGVEFRSEIDGAKIFLTPEKAVEIQQVLGSDIMMALDICSGYPANREEIAKAVEMTTAWATRCVRQKGRKIERKKDRKQMLFGIVQGGVYPDLRQKSLDDLLKLNFDGYALGGLAVGEPISEAYKIVRRFAPLLPEGKPRYLMGVGVPEQMVRFVKMGIDMFDCVIPTRHARHGELFVFQKRGSLAGKFYRLLHVNNSQHKNNFQPIDRDCRCFACANFSRAYLHHLFKTKEPLGQRLATVHNLRFFLDFMARLRKEIREGKI